MADTTLDFLLYLALIGAPFICLVTAIGGINGLQRSLESPTAGVSSVIGWFIFILTCVGVAVACFVILWNGWK